MTVYRYFRFYEYDTRIHVVNPSKHGGICFCFKMLDESKCLVSYVLVDKDTPFKKKNSRRLALKKADGGDGLILTGNLQLILSTFLDNILSMADLRIRHLQKMILECKSSFMTAEQHRINYLGVLSGMQLTPRYKVLST